MGGRHDLVSANGVQAHRVGGAERISRSEAPFPMDLVLADWLGIAALGVSVVGFGVTIFQLVRTKNATVAATDALQLAATRMSVNHLLVLLPQFRLFETELDSAMTINDKTAAARTLLSYSQAANQVASLMENISYPVDDTFLVSLRESAQEASLAKAAIVSGTTKAVRLTAKLAAEKINAVSMTAAGLTASYQSKVG